MGPQDGGWARTGVNYVWRGGSLPLTTVRPSTHFPHLGSSGEKDVLSLIKRKALMILMGMDEEDDSGRVKGDKKRRKGGRRQGCGASEEEEEEGEELEEDERELLDSEDSDKVRPGYLYKVRLCQINLLYTSNPSVCGHAHNPLPQIIIIVTMYWPPLDRPCSNTVCYLLLRWATVTSQRMMTAREGSMTVSKHTDGLHYQSTAVLPAG